MPQPITQAWELTIPIPWWILNFYHIERGLLITLEIMILAHRESEEDNSFSIEIYFRRVIEGTLIPQTIKELRIVFRYLCPNPYYQTPETETVCAPSRVSLEEGEIPTGFSTPSLSPPEELWEVPLPPSELPELPELPGASDFNWRVAAVWRRVESHNQRVRELGLTTNQWLDTVLTHVQSRINLDEPAFTEGNITFRQLQNINRNKNPQFYSESSQHKDDNHEPVCLDGSDSQDEDEEEGEEENPLPMPDPMGTNSLTPSLEQDSSEWFSNNTRESLERHLGTIIEETFRERSQTSELL